MENVQSDDNEATELASGLNSKAEIGVDREELENNLSQAEEEIRSLIRNLTESNNKVEIRFYSYSFYLYQTN